MPLSTVPSTTAGIEIHIAEQEMANERARLIAAARRARPVKSGAFTRLSRRNITG